jgi:hypothetical protein
MRHAPALLFAPAALLASAALADGPPPSPPPSASVAASSVPDGGSPPAPSAAPPPPARAPLGPLGAIPDWPDASSPIPKPAEWDAAVAVPLTRPSDACTTSRVREWLRVSCRFGEVQLTGVRVIGGSTAAVAVSDRRPDPGQATMTQWKDRIPHGVDVTFSVRRGDRRVLEVVRTAFEGRYSVGEDTAAMISALWLPGDAGPTIVVD